MPLFPGGPHLGLGLWNSVSWTLGVELVMFAAGSWIYLGITRAKDAVGRWGLYTTSIVGALVIAAWAWWVDRHRAVASRID
jgi:hypothetical protein